MKKNFIFSAAVLAVMAVPALAGDYVVNVPLTEDEEGAMAFLVNSDSGEKIDSVLVSDGAAVFKGSVESALPTVLVLDGRRVGMLFLEPGNINVNVKGQEVTGTALNEAYNALAANLGELAAQFRAVQGNDEAANVERERIEALYTATLDSVMKANISNPLGYTLFCDMAYNMSLDELQKALDAEPSLRGYKRIQKLLNAAINKATTQPGNMYKDFAVTQPDGSVKKLSDYVGKGKYVLVDFWASWCGPCIRQTAVLKDILAEYGDKGLEVLGVAVWDKLDDTLNGIKTHDLPWEQILDAQSIPTELYGISAIPTIILFSPEGKILSRDKQSDELKADVKAALEGTLK